MYIIIYYDAKHILQLKDFTKQMRLMKLQRRWALRQQ